MVSESVDDKTAIIISWGFLRYCQFITDVVDARNSGPVLAMLL